MNKDKTEIIIVLDRSGSMGTIKNDMEGGLKKFIEDQQKQPGKCLVSLYQFDTQYEKVFEAVDVQNVRNIILTPRGGTALHDAVGKTINSVGARLKDTPENDRPGLVIFLVITDGEENSSKEFSVESVKQMVTHQTEKYNWKFTFLGANQDAVLTGQSMGYSLGGSLTYAATSKGVFAAMNSVTSSVNLARSATMTCGVAPDINYTAKDREDAMDGNVQVSATNTQAGSSPSVTANNK